MTLSDKKASQPGRPTDYSEELTDRICERIANGESLRSICRDDGMPDKSTVFRWLAAHDAFRDQYARAREAQADTFFEDVVDIADDGRNDTYEDDEGNVRTDHDVIARSRLRVDARKWAAARLNPKKYGDKVALTGGDGGPLQVNVVQRASNKPAA